MNQQDKQAIKALKQYLRKEKIFTEEEIKQYIQDTIDASQATGLSIPDVCSFAPIALSGRTKPMPVSAKVAGATLRDIIKQLSEKGEG